MIKRRVLIGLCAVLVASAATHTSSGHAASNGAITIARATIARRVQDPSALFLTAGEARRVLGHVNRIDLSFGRSGSDFSAIVLYRPLTGDLAGQLIFNRLPDASPSAEENGCRARGHKVSRVNIGRYHTYYCADDITFGYLWRWDHRIYAVDSKYYGGIRPAGLRALISHMTYVR